MKILVAEDTLVGQKLLERTLSRWGYEVVVVENGAQALQALMESDIELVISDWMMPEMDGVEFCERVRARDWERYVYIIMLTALGETEHLTRAMEAGADDFLNKPLNRDELRARMMAAERMLSVHRQLAQRVRELEESRGKVRELKELLPICMYCKRIRDDDDYWQQIESYIHTETGTDFSHGVCPECFETVMKKELEELRRHKDEERAAAAPN